MKKNFTFKLMLLLCALVVGSNAWADTYTMSIDSGTKNGTKDVHWTANNATLTHSNVSWSASFNGGTITNSNYYVQIGSKNSPFSSITLSTSEISGTISEVKVGCGAYNSNATVAVTVGGNAFGGNAQSVGAAPGNTGPCNKNTFSGSASGAIAITITNGDSGRAGYIDYVSVTYSTGGGGGGTTTSDFAISGAPVALSFDLYDDYSAKTVSYTTSSTGTVSVVANDYITTSVNESTKTITVTPKSSVTPSAQTITVNQAADATYAAGSGTFTVTISDSTPPATYDFTNIDGFSSWGSSYSEHTVTYYDAEVIFASANKQSGTITNQPVTKGGDVVLKMTDGSKISEVKFVCTQWGTKEQTITLHYSTNGGSSYTSTGITSTNFRITDNNLPDETNAVKITFSSTDNQVGITSATIVKVCEKSIAGCGDSGKAGYYLIASPVASVTPTADNGFLANQYDLYSFDQSQAGEEWQNFKQDHFTNIVSGMGYLYANRGNVTLSFEGSPYNGNGEIDLDYTASVAFSGWNLIGNPYSVTAYLSDKRPFYRMNDDGDEIIAREDSEKAIAPMEGIFVQAANADDAVTFTTTEPSKASNSSITLDIIGNNDNVIDRAIVNFDGNTLEKLMIDENNTKIYIPQNNTRYAVACGDAKGSMPVNFKAAETGKYTISVNAEGLDMDYLHLIDRLTGEDINLLLEDSYSFIASKQDPESRFILSFTANGYNNDADATFAYQNGSEIIVNGEGDLQIFDVTGRKVMTTKVNGVAIINGLNSGVYIIRVIGETQKTQKIVVR